MNEDHVAFHEVVTLLGWRDSSSTGAKVTFGLTDRASLEHFDHATRRRGKKAGQRYQASMCALAVLTPDEYVASMADPPMMSLGALELWFAGANWAHQDGARVAFTVTADDLEVFKLMTTQDCRHGTPTVFWLTLVQIDDDERPVNQAQADVVEAAASPPEPDKPKGGPLSKRVAMMCQEDEFQWYVSEREDRDEKSTFEQADAYVKRICNVTSKVEFDLSPDAWFTFQREIQRPYFEWGGAAPQ